MHGKGDSVKIFTVLTAHGIHLLIPLVLLIAQANCELTLPGLMSDIVDVGISQGGIESVVPEKILADDLAQVELFLDAKTAQALDEAYTAADAAGVRTFEGTDEVRSELEEPLAEAEMLVYQMDQGIPTDAFIEGMGLLP